MKPYYQDDLVTLYNGDCKDVMRLLRESGQLVSSVVTDPPYGISFMSKKWDYDVPSVDTWSLALDVLKPGGHILAFAGTRTQHRMAVNIEDAGFDIRDMIAWVYGSGFPKNHDVSKAIDKAAGVEREVVRTIPDRWAGKGAVLQRAAQDEREYAHITAPATEAAKQWKGYGTALKPAFEPITLARKPLEGTVAENVLTHGTGALDIDGCRVAHDEECRMMAPSQANIDRPSEKHRQAGRREAVLELKPQGRWPANLIHDGGSEVMDLFPGEGDKSKARFFYCAKANKKERGEGNNHPTVKPIELMKHLVTMVTHRDGIVLDPFAGSGSTLIAAKMLGIRCIGVELSEDYCEIAVSRITSTEPLEKPEQLELPQDG